MQTPDARPVFTFVSPPPLTAALHIAAQRDMTSVSGFIRAALLEKLRALGIPTSLEEERLKLRNGRVPIVETSDTRDA